MPPMSCSVHIEVERFGHLAVRRREGLLRVLIRRGLVLAGMQHVGIGPDLVEQAAEEELVGRDSGEVERAGWHQEDAVGGRGEVVLLLAAVLEVRDDRLARLAEVGHRIADFLKFPPQGLGT